MFSQTNSLDITAFIYFLRERYIEEGLVESYYDINCGLCVDFAEEIESQFGDAYLLSNDHFIVEREDRDGWNGDQEDIWDEEWLREYHSLPPQPFSVADLTTYISGYHCWIYYNHKHYDAECPEGVENFFDLPFFKRYLEMTDDKSSGQENEIATR